MKKTLLFFTILISGLSVHAQKEANNWTFGYNAFLTWNTTRSFPVTPVSSTGATLTSLDGLPNSPKMSSNHNYEGCFTLSDSNGALLFYSDGVNVWDKTGATMTNGTGLAGGSSSTQSGILFPYPNVANKYVEVTMGETENSSPRIAYSIIDMTLRSGAGDVVAAQKNQSFPEGAAGLFTESLTSIAIPNTKDYWVIAPTKVSSPSTLYAWKFTAAGPQAPAKTSLGVVIKEDRTSGHIKLTPDGRHFVMTVGGWPPYRLVYGDFDMNTGFASNVKNFQYPGDTNNWMISPYGLEFSPNGKLLYVSFADARVVIYNVDEIFTKPSLDTVTQKSYNLVFPAPPYSGLEGIQQAVDGRLYMVTPDQTYMWVIDDPNNFDSPKIYKTGTGFISGGATAQYGLPNFAPNWFNMTPAAKKFACTGYDYKFTTKVDMSGGIDAPVSLKIDFGDTKSTTVPLVSGQTDYQIAHTYQNSGTYTVIITPVKSGGVTLTPSTVTAYVVDCSIRTNPQIRVDLQNVNTKSGL
ncbi:hypothetical protein [Flavobacterium reichenbachii]|uniref:PKD domain-containing protein n=1 Tax=Flavobacterium reichenbachii TaxID=362418 RepID=A0A085ZNU7_9FLAO|nr:hypothetical protein [Flavobacterium reichenbachii]KFF06111.1 hypothetical protein IW19_11480 [Flavobacterium reichenbachii]OXB14666.1 hypothetical protein B0A68_11465 [Flavobacterium reichenbachii]